MRWWWPVLAGCGPVPTGTAVGNPGDLDAKASRADVNVTLDAVLLEAEALVLDGCGWPGVDVPVVASLDGLLPSVAPIEVPGGTWCGLALRLASPVVVEGRTTAGTTFSLEVALPALGASGRFLVDGQALLLELPLPLSATALDALGPTVVQGVDDPLAVQLAADVLAGTALWSDDDGDGVLSLPDRRVLAPVAFETGLPMAAMADQAGCGCGHGRSGVSGLVLLLVLYGRRRARRASGESGARN